MKNRMKNLMIRVRDKIVAKKPKQKKPEFGATKAPLTETRSRPSDKEMAEHYQHLRRVCTLYSGKPRPRPALHEVKPLQLEEHNHNLDITIQPLIDNKCTISLEFAPGTDPAYIAALDAFIGMNGGEEERKNVKPLTEPEKREYEKMVKKVFSAPDVD